MTELIEFQIVIYALSLLVYDKLIYNTYSLLVICGLFLAVLNAFLPQEAFNRWLFPVEEDRGTELLYSVAQFQFHEAYERTNPATKFLATQRWEAYRNSAQGQKLQSIQKSIHKSRFSPK